MVTNALTENLVLIANFVLNIWIWLKRLRLRTQSGITLKTIFVLLNVQMGIIRQARNVK